MVERMVFVNEDVGLTSNACQENEGMEGMDEKREGMVL